MHMHKLETVYPTYVVKGQPGIIRGHGGQILIITKMHYPLFVT